MEGELKDLLKRATLVAAEIQALKQGIGSLISKLVLTHIFGLLASDFPRLSMIGLCTFAQKVTPMCRLWRFFRLLA